MPLTVKIAGINCYLTQQAAEFSLSYEKSYSRNKFQKTRLQSFIWNYFACSSITAGNNVTLLTVKIAGTSSYKSPRLHLSLSSYEKSYSRNKFSKNSTPAILKIFRASHAITTNIHMLALTP